MFCLHACLEERLANLVPSSAEPAVTVESLSTLEVIILCPWPNYSLMLLNGISFIFFFFISQECGPWMVESCQHYAFWVLGFEEKERTSATRMA